MLLSVITVGLSSVCRWGIDMNSGGGCNLFTDKTTLAIGNTQTKGRLYTPIRADKNLPLLIACTRQWEQVRFHRSCKNPQTAFRWSRVDAFVYKSGCLIVSALFESANSRIATHLGCNRRFFGKSHAFFWAILTLEKDASINGLKAKR